MDGNMPANFINSSKRKLGMMKARSGTASTAGSPVGRRVPAPNKPIAPTPQPHSNNGSVGRVPLGASKLHTTATTGAADNAGMGAGNESRSVGTPPASLANTPGKGHGIPGNFGKSPGGAVGPKQPGKTFGNPNVISDPKNKMMGAAYRMLSKGK